eukprot:m.104307 g.104307  ORF g.104307 m.104307 type:complete len:60 (-) comp27562_c0_seq1:106-285(-)
MCGDELVGLNNGLTVFIAPDHTHLGQVLVSMCVDSPPFRSSSSFTWRNNYVRKMYCSLY